MYYVGIGVLLLAVWALKVARGRYALSYFTLLSVVTLILTLRATTPLHAALYLILPGFENLHRHFPDRILMIFYLGPALLAGATISSLQQRRLLSAVLVFLAAAELIAAGPSAHTVAHNIEVDPINYFAPSAAVLFMRSRPENEVFRYVGYDPALRRSENGQSLRYSYAWFDDRTRQILVNDWATLFGLQDTQGYNPIEPKRYAQFTTVLNGQSQDYHGANVLASGLSSPLLNLLNVRYLIIPADLPPDRPDLLHLNQRYPTVYTDKHVRVLENTSALPRAWLVHQAHQVTTSEALTLLATGTVDPRQTALIEGTPPALALPANPSADHAAITTAEPDRMLIQTQSQTAGLLMLSEMYYPAWHAYVDGQRVPLHAADGALRAVPVPAGTHTVELRYESTTLRLGLAISLLTYLLLTALLVTLWARGRLLTHKFS
jgi:hypothetical protein